MIALGVFCRFVWIGDTTFLGDEAMLLRQALSAYGLGDWPDHGLMGSRGAVYGPMAIWIYQAFLRVSHSLVTLAAMKTCFDTVLLIAGMALLWRGRIRFSRAWWALPAVSPYFWLYSRQLWDNNFLVGFSVIALGSALCFLNEGRFRFLFLSALALACSLNTHLMALSLTAGIALAVLLNEGRRLAENPLKTLASMVPFGILIPYFFFLRGNSPEPLEWRFSLQALDGSLLGARLLGAGAFGEYFLGVGEGLSWAKVWLAIPAWGIALILVALSWLGIGRVVRQSPTPLRSVLLSVFGFQVLLSFYKNIHAHPHYFNAVWPIFWIFVGEGFEVVLRKHSQWERVALAVPFFTVLSLLQFQWVIHQHHGMRSSHYGPALGELVRIHRESDHALVEADYAHLGWASHRDTFDLLQKLEPIERVSMESVPRATVRRVDYASAPPDAALKWKKVLKQAFLELCQSCRTVSGGAFSKGLVDQTP